MFRGVCPVLRGHEHDERQDGDHEEGRAPIRGHGIRPTPQQVQILNKNKPICRLCNYASTLAKHCFFLFEKEYI